MLVLEEENNLLELYQILRKNDGVEIPLEDGGIKKISLKEILFPHKIYRNSHVIDIVQTHALNLQFHIEKQDYEELYHAALKLRQITHKNDLIIFVGRSPGWLYCILSMLNPQDPNDINRRSLVQINFSGSPNQKQDVKFIEETLRDACQFYSHVKGLQQDIAALSLPIDLISPEWVIYYQIARKTITPNRIDYFHKYLTSLSITPERMAGRRIILVDRIRSGSGLHCFCILLQKLFAKKYTINPDIYGINIEKNHLSTSSIYNFEACGYPKDKINYLGDLGIPFSLGQKLDDTPSWESLFTHFPPPLWEPRYASVLRKKPHPKAFKILKSLFTHLGLSNSEWDCSRVHQGNLCTLD